MAYNNKFKNDVQNFVIDSFHQKAGNTKVVELHGQLPDNIILYGDGAPMYQIAYKIVKSLEYNNSYLLL